MTHNLISRINAEMRRFGIHFDAMEWIREIRLIESMSRAKHPNESAAQIQDSIVRELRETLEVEGFPLVSDHKHHYSCGMANIQIPSDGSIATVNLGARDGSGNFTALGSLTAVLDDGTHAYIAASGVGQFQIVPKNGYTATGNTVNVTVNAIPQGVGSIPSIVVGADIAPAGTGTGGGGTQAVSIEVTSVVVSLTAPQPDPGSNSITIAVS